MKLLSESISYGTKGTMITLQEVLCNEDLLKNPLVVLFQELLNENSWSRDFSVGLNLAGSTQRIFITLIGTTISVKYPESISDGFFRDLPDLDEIRTLLLKMLTHEITSLKVEKAVITQKISDNAEVFTNLIKKGI